MASWLVPLMVMLIGYVVGSIPFGILLTRFAGAGDLRAIGSGSIGATNVLRTGRKGIAAATLFLDGAKGAVAVAVGERLLPGSGAALGGAMALVGHCYPVWLRFRGGKGVATMLFVSFAFHWIIGLAFASMWLAMFAMTRISSAGGMSAALAALVTGIALGERRFVPALAAMAIIVLWRHRANIGRLLKGEEPRFGKAAHAR